MYSAKLSHKQWCKIDFFRKKMRRCHHLLGAPQHLQRILYASTILESSMVINVVGHAESISHGTDNIIIITQVHRSLDRKGWVTQCYVFMSRLQPFILKPVSFFSGFFRPHIKIIYIYVNMHIQTHMHTHTSVNTDLVDL